MRVTEEIQIERNRQIKAEDWSSQHDDSHVNGELALAAGCYAINSAKQMETWKDADGDAAPRQYWPFDGTWWKPKNCRRDLIRAGALIVAEIERIDRRDSKATPECIKAVLIGDGLHRAIETLEWIAKGEIEIFDDGEQAMVIVSADANEMQERARKALSELTNLQPKDEPPCE